MRNKALIEIISFTLIILFVYTAVSKLLAYDVFAAVLNETPVVKHFAGWIAWMIPTIELVVALLLIIPSFRAKGLIASFILLFFLTGYLLWMVGFHKELPCNCGGVVKALSWKQHIVFNAFFLALAATGILLTRGIRQVMIGTIPD
jgi:hypothetical protein